MFISKRVLIIIGVAAVVLVGAISFTLAFAFSHVNANQPATASDTPTVVLPSTTQKAGSRACLLGTIQSLGNQSFVVNANQGTRTVTVSVNAQTTYVERGSQASLSFTTLTVGEKVRVTAQGPCGKQVTTVLAQSVTVLPAAGNPTPATSPAAFR
ncbi:MAG TPA: hypothetical protein VKB35_02970 [Ktedonobacteraceae bacterium]|nr:hypothetical protein [Ktedonobacteraceae bacterium]